MNDSTVSQGLTGPSAPTHASPGDSSPALWLLLIHHLPPKPDYLRVKVRRRLERLGALPIKSSVYVLPYRPDTVEDFQWLASEIGASGGEATLCAASFLAGASDDELVASFRAARGADYAAIARAADALERGDPTPDLARLARRITTVAEIDHFESAARRDAETALRAAEGRLQRPEADTGPQVSDEHTASVRGGTWVTRAGIFVDRIACAWLIRRFIDPDARFVFVSDVRYLPRAGEVRFDMFDAEYTHEGDRCTFEVLLARFGIEDTALSALAEIVHDIDVKDDKFSRPEAPGVAAVLGGIRAMTSDDEVRLERGSALFDGLYATLGGAVPHAP